jgi:hypothetical protein
MKKSSLLAATAVLALTAGAASAAGLHPTMGVTGVKISPIHHSVKQEFVWNQNSSSNGGALDSQNFTSGTFAAYDDSGADDFLVSVATTVNGVDASGTYFNGSGPAASFDVTFYADAGGKPGAVVAAFTDQAYTDNSGDFNIPLCKAYKKGKCKPGKVKFKPGKRHTAATYWVSVVANCKFTGGCGEWGWDTRPLFAGTNPAVWENPGGGFAICPTWCTLGGVSAAYAGDDFMFDLY